MERGPENKVATVVVDVALLARVVLGATFIYMGLVKVVHPVEFLKLVRQYHLTENSFFLNAVAGGLPWFEVFTGVLLIAGIGTRGAALLAFGMLVPFTILVAQRAAEMHQANGTPFCGLRFDCGCGNGEVWICRKLAENIALALAALLTVVVRCPRASLRYSLFDEKR